MKLLLLLSALAALTTTSPIAQAPTALSTGLYPANTSAPTNTTSLIDTTLNDTAPQMGGDREFSNIMCDASYMICIRDHCPFNAWGCDKVCMMTVCQDKSGPSCKGLNWCYAYTG